jgi:uncharacterized protein DUF5666
VSEQERADRLAQDIERLMAGEPVQGGDPLLDLAKTLGQTPLRPSAQAYAQFERQLDQWFRAPSAPAVPRHAPAPILTVGVGVVVLAVIVAGIFVIGPLVAPTPTYTPTPTQTASPMPTSTPTTRPTDTPAAPTSSPTPLTFSRVVVSGRIESIQGNTIVVLGQPIQIDGSLGRLCVGDLVRAEVSVGADGTYSASRDAVTVEASACAPLPTVRAQSPTAAPSGGQPDHHHGGDD